MRDSSDSRTLRSNPEYAWMMYHFIFGLRGASPPAAASAGAAPAAVSTGAAALSGVPAAPSTFSSSTMKSLPSPRGLTAREIMQHPLQRLADRQIYQPEIEPEQKHGDDDYRGRSLDFLARRRRNLLHLRAHVAVKRLDPLRPGPHGGRNRVLFHCCCHTFPLSSTASLKTLAGAEGFEPPSSVLETDSLT